MAQTRFVWRPPRTMVLETSFLLLPPFCRVPKMMNVCKYQTHRCFLAPSYFSAARSGGNGPLNRSSTCQAFHMGNHRKTTTVSGLLPRRRQCVDIEQKHAALRCSPCKPRVVSSEEITATATGWWTTNPGDQQTCQLEQFPFGWSSPQTAPGGLALLPHTWRTCRSTWLHMITCHGTRIHRRTLRRGSRRSNTKRGRKLSESAAVSRSEIVTVHISDTRILKHYPSFDIPSFENIVVTDSFASSVNARLRVPNWVAERLTQQEVQAARSRRGNCAFQYDPTLTHVFPVDSSLTTNPSESRKSQCGHNPIGDNHPMTKNCVNVAQGNNFRHSKGTEYPGFTRGHLAAAGNHRASRISHQATFLIPTNIVPQDRGCNHGGWKQLEEYCRDLTKTFKNVFVVSGTLWLPRHTRVPYKVPSNVSGEQVARDTVAGGTVRCNLISPRALPSPCGPRGATQGITRVPVVVGNSSSAGAPPTKLDSKAHSESYSVNVADPLASRPASVAARNRVTTSSCVGGKFEFSNNLNNTGPDPLSTCPVKSTLSQQNSPSKPSSYNDSAIGAVQHSGNNYSSRDRVAATVRMAAGCTSVVLKHLREARKLPPLQSLLLISRPVAVDKLCQKSVGAPPLQSRTSKLLFAPAKNWTETGAAEFPVQSSPVVEAEDANSDRSVTPVERRAAHYAATLATVASLSLQLLHVWRTLRSFLRRGGEIGCAQLSSNDQPTTDFSKVGGFPSNGRSVDTGVTTTDRYSHLRGGISKLQERNGAINLTQLRDIYKRLLGENRTCNYSLQFNTPSTLEASQIAIHAHRTPRATSPFSSKNLFTDRQQRRLKADNGSVSLVMRRGPRAAPYGQQRQQREIELRLGSSTEQSWQSGLHLRSLGGKQQDGADSPPVGTRSYGNFEARSNAGWQYGDKLRCLATAGDSRPSGCENEDNSSSNFGSSYCDYRKFWYRQRLVHRSRPRKKKRSERLMVIRFVGKGEVAVPTHLFKVVAALDPKPPALQDAQHHRPSNPDSGSNDQLNPQGTTNGNTAPLSQPSPFVAAYVVPNTADAAGQGVLRHHHWKRRNSTAGSRAYNCNSDSSRRSLIAWATRYHRIETHASAALGSPANSAAWSADDAKVSSGRTEYVSDLVGKWRGGSRNLLSSGRAAVPSKRFSSRTAVSHLEVPVEFLEVHSGLSFNGLTRLVKTEHDDRKTR